MYTAKRSCDYNYHKFNSGIAIGVPVNSTISLRFTIYLVYQSAIYQSAIYNLLYTVYQSTAYGLQSTVVIIFICFILHGTTNL